MDCTEVRELLSEYMDAVLETAARRSLEEHLSACSACSEELAALRALVREMESLDPVPAPGDFLEQVHEKLESPSPLLRLLHALFMPFRIKIPLEFAGLVATALLVFVVLHTERPSMGPSSVPQVVKEQRTPAENRLLRSAPADRAVLAPTPSSPSFTAQGKTDEKALVRNTPIELALVLRGAPEQEISTPRSPITSKPKALGGADSEESAGAPAPRALYKAPGGLGQKEEMQAPKAKGDLSHAAGAVEEMIRLSGGEVKEVEPETGSRMPRSILLDIPAERLPELLKRLEGLGTIGNPPPALREGIRGTLSVRLRMRYPDK
jgi:hypothetical protein